MSGSRLFVSVVGLCIALAVPASAFAQQSSPEAQPTPRFVIRAGADQPNAWFELELSPGESASLAVDVSNVGTVDGDVLTYVANGQTAPNGGFSAGTQEDALDGAGLWIDYPHQVVQIPAGSTTQLEFSVRVPEATPPGEYVAALVVQTPEPMEIEGNSVFRQIIRSAISVEIVVPGDPSLGMTIGEPDVRHVGDDWILETPVENTGTARLRPQGELVVTADDGTEIAHSRVEMGSVYSLTETSVTTTLPSHVPAGTYRISMTLNDAATGVSASISDVPVELDAAQESTTFAVRDVTVAPSGDPLQYADISTTIANSGETIPTANVLLMVQRDGEELERYLLAEDRALPQGETEFSQRYIPIDGWQLGTYTFQLQIVAVSGSTETVIETIDIDDEIHVP